GAVERWYNDNGWTYPVQGPAATGISGVQQFFEALGLTTPPRVEISEQAIQLHGSPGERLEHVVRVETSEKRPGYAHATCDQPWLRIGAIALEGRSARIPIEVPSVPSRPGELLRGRVTVTANGNQRFWVAVMLAVDDRHTGIQAPASSIRSAVVLPQAPSTAIIGTAIPYATVAPEPSAPVAQLAAPMTEPTGGSKWLHAVPVLLLLLALLGVVTRDLLLPSAQQAAAEEGLLDPEPRIEVR